jgi:transposase
VKAYYKNNDSYVSAQRVFQNHFNIPRNAPVPSAHAIKTWIENLEETGSTLKTKVGSVKSVRMPENVARVEGAVQRSIRFR